MKKRIAKGGSAHLEFALIKRIAIIEMIKLKDRKGEMKDHV